MLTPGVSVSRSSNFRPRIGVDSTVIWFKVLATAARVVSTTGAAVVTRTVSATPDMRMPAASVTACPTVKPMFSWTNVANPGSV